MKTPINTLVQEPTLAELAAEPLSAKNRRLVQAKCAHEEVYSSTVSGPTGTFTTAFCMDCGKTWRSEERR